MPLQATSGAASYDAFGGGVAAVPNYIEDVFSTYLYTGNGSTQTITNGIDLSTKGGLVWCKIRNTGDAHALFDTARGFPNWLASNTTGAQNAFGTPNAADMVATSTGFSMNNISSASNSWNSSGNTFASWTFRKQPKFFDVVTFTTNSSGDNYAISHSLGSRPGFIIVKRTDASSDWYAGHRGASVSPDNFDYNLKLNTTAANIPYAIFQSVDETSFQFIGSADPSPSGSLASGTFVAYVYAHDAGGFGLTGTDNVISCGSFTTNGSGEATVNLGYEPQWVLWKQSNAATDWYVVDNMRGWNMSRYDDVALRPNLSNADYAGGYGNPTATGFFIEDQNASAPHIYIAIRRGPMKVPTSGTSVYNADFYKGANSPPSWNSGFVTDMGIWKDRTGGASNAYDRLRGEKQLQMNSSGAESTDTTAKFYYMNGWGTASGAEDTTLISWNFRRAPSFFDEVCYTGTGSDVSITHNLQAVPQLAIIKKRNGTPGWVVGCPLLSNTAYGFLNDPIFFYTSGGNPYFQNTAWSDQYLYLRTDQDVNDSGGAYVAYLFATCAGVSKVGSVTVTAGQQININCGFTGGARFVMMKRTDAAGDWMVFDTARGINVGDDPYLLLNSTSAETTGYDWISPYTTGFQFRENLYAASSTYIYLAIA